MPSVKQLVIYGKADTAAGSVSCEGIDGRKIRGQEQTELEASVHIHGRGSFFDGGVDRGECSEGGVIDHGFAGHGSRGPDEGKCRFTGKRTGGRSGSRLLIDGLRLIIVTGC